MVASHRRKSLKDGTHSAEGKRQYRPSASVRLLFHDLRERAVISPRSLPVRPWKAIGLRRPYQRVARVSTHVPRSSSWTTSYIPRWRPRKSDRSRIFVLSVHNVAGCLISMVAGAAYAASATFRLGVPPLRGNEIELLLRLVEPQPHTLLVEKPEVPAN
jgi:hypothetical protein